MTDNPTLRDRFYTKYHGEEIAKCIQCGTCSGSCPLAPYMDFGPRQLFALAREGDMDEVLNADTMWLCVSCYNCTIKCPRDIAITDHMYSLKKMAAQEGIKPPAMLDLYRSFNSPVEKYGRLTDTAAIAAFGVHHPVTALKNLPLGIKLALKKRLDIKSRPLEDLSGFKKVMEKAEELERTETMENAET